MLTRPESAPLLNHPGDHQTSTTNDRSFFSALTHPTRPLTNLEKLLAGAAVLLLITTGTFVGLFAGTEVALKKERAGHGGGGGEWRTVTATETATRTSTAPGSTTTVVPTGKPQKVSCAIELEREDTGGMGYADRQDLCVTPECVKLAASILESINPDEDPCNDFYEFASTLPSLPCTMQS